MIKERLKESIFFDKLKVNFNLSLNSKKFVTKREIILGSEIINIDQKTSQIIIVNVTNRF